MSGTLYRVTLRPLARLACALFAVAATASVCAQGPTGTFAEAMTLAELGQLLERCGVDARGEWSAIEALHTAYADEAARLRADELEPIELRMRDFVEGANASAPASAAEAAKWVRAYLAGRRAAAELDGRLFEAVRAKLGETSRERVSRAQAVREREALTAGLARGSAPPSVLVDVPAVVRGLEFGADRATARATLEACESALGDYDARQTRQLRELADAEANAFATMRRIVEEIAVPQAGASDEEILAYSEKTRQAMAEALAGTLRPAKLLRESNARAAKAVAAALGQRDAELARRFVLAHTALAYPSIRDPAWFGVETTGVRLLRIKALSAAQRDSIRQEFMRWEALDTRLMEQQADAEDAYADASNGRGGAVDEEAHAVLTAKVEELQRRRDEAAMLALERFAAAVGPQADEWLKKIGTHEEADGFLPEGLVRLRPLLAPPSAEANAAVRDEAAVAPPRGMTAGESLWVSSPMGREWVDRIAMSVGATEAQRAIVEGLMRDYADAWEREVLPRVEPMLTIAQIRDRVSPADGSEPLGEEALTTMFASAAAARRAKREVDGRFFAGLEAAVDSDEQRRVVGLLRCARECGDRLPELDSVFDQRSGGEESANVALALISVRLAPASCAKAAQAIEGQIEPLIRTAHSVDSVLMSLWRDRALNMLMEANLARLNDASIWTQAQRDAAKRRDAVIGAGLAAAQAKARAQRAALHAAVAPLDASERRAVERAYLRDAYFTACTESEPAGEALELALALPGLTEAQRTALAIAREEYSQQREAAVESMVKVMQAESVAPPEGAVSTSSAIVGHIEDLQRYAMARDAARDQVMERMKATLNEAQQRSVGIK